MSSMSDVMKKVMDEQEGAAPAQDVDESQSSPSADTTDEANLESGAVEATEGDSADVAAMPDEVATNQDATEEAADATAAEAVVEPSTDADAAEDPSDGLEPAAPPLEGGPVPEYTDAPASQFVADKPACEPRETIDGETSDWDPKRVDPAVIAFHDRYSAICEQYRSIRARLLTMSPGYGRQVLAITSSVPEEGKSVSTLNLSLVMAEGGEHRILAVDGDLRRSSLARMLGIPHHTGFVDVLRGDVELKDAVQPTPFPNLHILPAGEVQDSAYSEVLGGPNTSKVLDLFREEYDYTFVDTPPVTTVSDVSLLAPHCNGAIVVVEMHRTPEPSVQQAVRTLQANNVKILGCILSRYRERGVRYYDQYYSHYYYGRR